MTDPLTRTAALDAITAARHAALDDLTQVEGALRRVADATVTIARHAGTAQGRADWPAELQQLAGDAAVLVDRTVTLRATIVRLDAFGRGA